MIRRSALVQSIFAVLGTIVFGLIRGLNFSQPLTHNLRSLSDGAFVTGMLLSCLGGLSLVSSTGFFDLFAYGFKSLIVLFTPFKKPASLPKFFDYKMDKNEKRQPPSFVGLLVGLCTIGLAALLLFLYYQSLPA